MYKEKWGWNTVDPFLDRVSWAFYLGVGDGFQGWVSCWDVWQRHDHLAMVMVRNGDFFFFCWTGSSRVAGDGRQVFWYSGVWVRGRSRKRKRWRRKMSREGDGGETKGLSIGFGGEGIVGSRYSTCLERSLLGMNISFLLFSLLAILPFFLSYWFLDILTRLGIDGDDHLLLVGI